MERNNLLASVTLFSELYNSESYKGIPEIISEFIQNAIAHKRKYNLTSLEVKEILKELFGFEIPESVVRTVLRKNLKDITSLDNGIFNIDKDKLDSVDHIDREMNQINLDQEKIFLDIIKFISEKKGLDCEKDRESIFESVIHFLMGNGANDPYIDLISAYVVTRESDTEFRKVLDNIKEGVILYQGINYSTNVSELGNWDKPLTIFLSTEHMFSAAGYNGVLYKEIFTDFISLVNEINETAGKQLIKLKYLEETREDISNFFTTAESIVRGYKKLKPTVPAMKAIVNDCNHPSEVKGKLADFNDMLKSLGVEFQDFKFDINDSEYNVVDTKVIAALKTEVEGTGRRFDEDECYTILRIFTRINTFRKGNSSYPFENVRYIYLTENNFIKYVAHNHVVKFSDYDVAFAKDMDFVISKFWFKLKKGFADKPKLPKSFDAVNRAKIVLATHIGNSLSEGFTLLKDKVTKGELTEEKAVLLNESLKEKPGLPEEINKDNIDKALDFLNDDNFTETVIREQERKDRLLEETQKEKDTLERELDIIKQEKKRKEEKKAKKKLNKEIVALAEKHADEQCKLFIQNKKSDFYYALWRCILITTPVILAGIFSIKVIREKFIDQNWVLGIIIIVALSMSASIALIGRSFVFDKDRMSSGINWMLISLRNKRKEKVKETWSEKKKQYKIENN